MKPATFGAGARAWTAILLASALVTTTTLAASTAHAQDAAPVCPSEYAWDAASNRCVSRATSYPTPLRQTTQATYVPQSVAMSGPRMIKDWHEGDPVPDGYRVTERMRTGLVVGGAVTFGVLYLISVLGASIVHDVNNSTGGTDNADALFVPGVGPFLEMGKTSSATGNVFNAIDGIGQCGGLAMLVIGLTSPKQVLVRNDLGKAWVLPTPYVAQGGGGLRLVGRF